MDAIHTTNARIDAIDQRTDDVRILTLAPDTPLHHRAGQYMRVSAGGHEARPFSIANAPQKDGRLVLHVRNRGAGLSAHLFSAKINDVIALEGPFGAMDIDAAQNRPVLMVAGGTGIAPMLALAGDIIRKGITEDGITLIYGARSESDIYCKRELGALLATGELTLHTVTNPATPDLELSRLGLNLSEHAIYLSGPEPMMFNVNDTLRIHLANPARIFTDKDFL